ncbi:hypothetical protein [Arcobacter sp.]|uniref:hypothetical protein n=1 Tax=unclassified Arcobacter TaxID=2593671 RepID=UPI003AFF9385
MITKNNKKIENKNKSKYLKNAIKSINSKQELTIQKANQIIGDVENFEKEITKKFYSYS